MTYRTFVGGFVNDLPALLGGEPVRPQGPPDWPLPDPEVAAAIEDAIRDGSWGRYDGGHVERLEQELAQFHHLPFALTCSSGTLAVELALRALQVRPGDEVILAAYDYEPNFLCVHHLGASPVLADVGANNWNLDPSSIEAAISPKTKALIVSHLHGGCVPMREVVEIASRHDVRLIEDAAQAIGATIQGRPAGTWGDIGVLSFGGSKLLSAGRGGALLTADAELHQRLRLALRRGVQQWAALSELQAAALRPQLAKLPARTAKRDEAVRHLGTLLAGIPGLRMFDNQCECRPAYYKLGFRFDEKDFGLPRSRFCQALRAEGVAMDAGFLAAHVGRSPARFRSAGNLIEAERAHSGAVILHHPVLLSNEADLAAVARAIRRTYANANRLI
jgi:dTDP-4-amino-4,6-dideoxygalactose transaminase